MTMSLFATGKFIQGTLFYNIHSAKKKGLRITLLYFISIKKIKRPSWM